MCYQELQKCLRRNQSYLLYGAGVVAYEVMAAIRELYQKTPCFCIVTSRNGNREYLDGVPVTEAGQLEKDLWKSHPVIIAAPEVYHKQMIETIRQYEPEECFCINTHLEYCLMSQYFKKTGEFTLLEQLKGPEEPQAEDLRTAKAPVTVYMAKSHLDKKLQKDYALPSWIQPVQAGAACTGLILNLLRDDTGEHISAKNPDYCELTVTYWAWKNRRDRYKGICHYRRIFLLSNQELRACMDHDVDVILPLPFLCYPDAAGQYGRYVSDRDKSHLKRALSEASPEYLPVLEQIDRAPYFYNYNMLIAKENVFDAYCEWMFRVLFCAEKYCAPNGMARRDRYAGYLGELLTTLYFIGNRDSLKIVHGEKCWMV